MNNDISQRIKRYRKGKGKTIQFMADTLNTTVSGYHKIENKEDGKLTIAQLRRIADVLDITVFELLEDSDEQTFEELINELANKYPHIEGDAAKGSLIAFSAALKTLALFLKVGSYVLSGDKYRIPASEVTEEMEVAWKEKGWAFQLSDEDKEEMRTIVNKVIRSINKIVDS